MNPRVKEVHPLENYRLLLVFINNERKVFDLKPYLPIGIFNELVAPDIFNSVKTVDESIQ